MQPRISIIVPTYNSPKTLKRCVESVLKQTLKPYQVIVVDNNSPSNSKLYLKNNFLGIKKLFLSSNTGVTGGRNAGIKRISKGTDYLLFFDHDMIADKSMLEELVKVAKSFPEIGIVTPKIYYLGDKKRIWSAGTGINLWTGQVIFRGGKDNGQYNKVEEVQVAPAAMLVKKEVINKIKNFDERYFATFEDTDFCFRARNAGFKTYYAPEAIAWHDLSTERDDEIKRLLDRAYFVGRNRVLFMKDFGKLFIVFLIFLPVYSAYYVYLSIKRNRFEDGMAFVRGTLSGLFS